MVQTRSGPARESIKSVCAARSLTGHGPLGLALQRWRRYGAVFGSRTFARPARSRPVVLLHDVRPGADGGRRVASADGVPRERVAGCSERTPPLLFAWSCLVDWLIQAYQANARNLQYYVSGWLVAGCQASVKKKKKRRKRKKKKRLRRTDTPSHSKVSHEPTQTMERKQVANLNMKNRRKRIQTAPSPTPCYISRQDKK